MVGSVTVGSAEIASAATLAAALTAAAVTFGAALTVVAALAVVSTTRAGFNGAADIIVRPSSNSIITLVPFPMSPCLSNPDFQYKCRACKCEKIFRLYRG